MNNTKYFLIGSLYLILAFLYIGKVIHHYFHEKRVNHNDYQEYEQEYEQEYQEHNNNHKSGYKILNISYYSLMICSIFIYFSISILYFTETRKNKIIL